MWPLHPLPADEQGIGVVYVSLLIQKLLLDDTAVLLGQQADELADVPRGALGLHLIPPQQLVHTTEEAHGNCHSTHCTANRSHGPLYPVVACSAWLY